MSEIEKMYENAGINQVCNTCELRGFKRLCPSKELCVRTNPPFTAEKQIKLIKWLSRRYIEVSNYDAENGRMYNIKPTVGDFATSFNYDFSECIAGCINHLWQDLTEEEKQQVKGILE